MSCFRAGWQVILSIEDDLSLLHTNFCVAIRLWGSYDCAVSSLISYIVSHYVSSHIEIASTGETLIRWTVICASTFRSEQARIIRLCQYCTVMGQVESILTHGTSYS